MDAVKNFAKIVVSAGYDSSAVSITLQDGDGAKLPTPATDGEFNLVWWNSTDCLDPSTDASVEIVRCTARVADVITVVRAQEETLASDKNLPSKQYKMILALTKKMMDDISIELISKLVNIVEDITPQLGGNLDLQSNSIVGEGGAEGVYIDSSGNVGIGTTNPTNILHVNAAAGPLSSQFKVTAGGYGALSSFVYAMDNCALGFDLDFTEGDWRARDTSVGYIGKFQDRLVFRGSAGNVWNGVATLTHYVCLDLANGNVGIGTTTPDRKLHVHKSATPGIRISDSVATEGVIIGLSGSHLPYIWGCEDSDFYLGTNATERLRVKNDGKVGIGTQVPTEKLDINSDAIRLRTAKTPATAGAPGNQGDIAWDADFIYICISTNSWHRAPHATW